MEWASCDVSWCTAALAVVALSLLVVRAWLAHGLWRRLGVPEARAPLLLGHAWPLMVGSSNQCHVMDDVYRQLQGRPYGGFYVLDKPCLMLRDPDLIWAMKNDSQHYSRRAMKVQMKGFRVDPIAKHLFDVDDRRWHDIMELFSAGFSAARTRRLSCWLERCGQGVQRELSRRLQGGVGWRDLDATAACARFAADAIGCCAFGIECGAIDDPRSAFLQLALKAMYPSRRRNLIEFLSMWEPEVAGLFFCGFFTRDIHDFFRGVALDILRYRQENHLCRDDVMQELLKARLNGLASDQNSPGEFSDDSLVAYVFATFGFGLGLISRALAFCLWELSQDAAAQTRAHQQVDAALRAHGGRLSYQAVRDMPYLDMVLCETLRLYPVLGGTQVEECTSTHRLAGRRGCPLVPAGTRVVAPTFSLLRDAAHFPQPLRFCPDRFSPENSKGRHPGLFMPFGLGQRRCVAEDFSMTVMKFGLAALLSQFELSRSPQSPPRPARLHPLSRLLTPRDTLWVRVAQRTWLPSD